MQNNNSNFFELLQIMNDLREKCPWDKKQTIESLRHLTIEEVYELTDAITEKNWQSIKEELGDLLLHLVFYSKIAEEQQQFSINDVITGICQKLIRRHPHIYGTITVNSEDEVRKNWEELKLNEGKKNIMQGVPPTLPALIKAFRIQEKAKGVGFEWENAEQTWKKVEEELIELQEAVNENNQNHINKEFGDVLFSLINYARFINVDPENALELTNKKFIARFSKMEDIANSQGNKLSKMSLNEMDAIWNEVKKTIQ